MNTLDTITSLEDLWLYTKQLHKALYPQRKLEPIMAGGKFKNPEYMFVFINPTYRNISSSATWQGKRRPWTGTKYIWKIFAQAGHFDHELLQDINQTKDWTLDFADKIYDHLEKRSFYFTNIVKWTGENADLPNSQQIKTFLPILLREIELVKPKLIVTFGLIPFNALVNEKLKLADYYATISKTNTLTDFPLIINSQIYKIIPCYFPVGRGNPKRAIEILKKLDSN